MVDPASSVCSSSNYNSDRDTSPYCTLHPRFHGHVRKARHRDDPNHTTFQHELFPIVVNSRIDHALFPFSSRILRRGTDPEPAGVMAYPSYSPHYYQIITKRLPQITICRQLSNEQCFISAFTSVSGGNHCLRAIEQATPHAFVPGLTLECGHRLCRGPALTCRTHCPMYSNNVTVMGSIKKK
ncbi:hypothetical protein EI94DRAFT_1746627 [Lactarius quietus]|nr:hypothetical protein EI94DRAFT_1746627 [Lactarius quietus]